MTDPLPAGFGVDFDRSFSCFDDNRTVVGGTPVRTIRLTDAGRDALASLRAGDTASEQARTLARVLTDVGLAHPRPPAAALDATVVVPVRDRVAMLDRCLAALEGETVIVVDDASVDACAMAAVCGQHGARLVRLDRGVGAAAARNAALATIETELVAFVDSDCVVPHGWLPELTRHFADPLVGAVAPRIEPVPPGGTGHVYAEFAGSRSPLDMGAEEGLVGPDARIPYVPSATLVVRRAALDPPFDPVLRYGEDVDLVWRLRDAGWRVRYVPDVVVRHEEPRGWSGLLRRRFNYGTSVAPLSRRHPGRLSHLVVSPLPGAAAALVLSGRPRWALVATSAHGVLLASRLRRNRLPVRRAGMYAVSSVDHTLRGMSHATTMFAGPGLLVALAYRPTRRAALALLLVHPLAERRARRPRLDPVRWSAACVADDIAYGFGVLRGCLDLRTAAPLLPRIVGTVPRPLSCRPRRSPHR